MDVALLSRIQFGWTVTFHYFFPPMTIGLSWMLVMIEGLYLKTKDVRYKEMAQFWTKIFSLFFVIGVVSGFVLVFGFGNNWANFSRFVGDVFGSMLAAEGIFAFFMEGSFLGIMLFGWDRVKPWLHYFSTILVSLGATFSATWIVMANSWMQTPSGYKIIGEGEHKRAVVINVWEAFFNPSFLDRLCHVLLGCWLTAVFFLLSISAYYFLRKKHLWFAGFTMRLALINGGIALLLQLLSGDFSARGAEKHQPLKFASMEAVYQTKEKGTPFYIVGFVSPKNDKVYGISIPHFLSLMTYRDLHRSVKGLNEFPREQWPYVPIVFYSYRTMIFSWCFMVFLIGTGGILWKRRSVRKHKWYLWCGILSVLLPFVANTAGWFTAEFGRQPWVVYNVMLTAEAVSSVVAGYQVLSSLLMFIVLYVLLFLLFLFLLNQKIQRGPGVETGKKFSDQGALHPFAKGENL